MKKFTVTYTLTRERISDVLCSAFEGGSNYWCRLETPVEPATWEFESEHTPENEHWLQDYPLNPGGAIYFSELEDADHKKMRLDAVSLQRGLNILARKYPWHIADILSEQDDANTGDALLQCALFGNIVYG